MVSAVKLRAQLDRVCGYQRAVVGRQVRLLPRPPSNRHNRRIAVPSPNILRRNGVVTGRALVEPEPPLSEEAEQALEGWVDDVLPFKPLSAEQVRAGVDQPPVVILPGFGNNTIDYTAPFGRPEKSLVAAVAARGFRPYVVELERKDWIKVARSLLSWRFYAKSCTTSPGYTWYLDLIAAKVAEALEETGCTQVDLIGHSAGGWLGRAFIGDTTYHAAEKEASPAVRRLITLGAPHMPPPDPRKDMTGGALAWVHKQYPGAWLARNNIPCMCVGGRTVRGNAKADKGTLGRYAFGSYAMVCGEGGGTEGDAVVPLVSAFLEGMEGKVLDGVFHSMSKVGTYGEDSHRPWYGSDVVVDSWLGFLVD